MRKDMADLITEHGMLARLAPESIELISRCARNVAFDPGERLLEEGRPATTFFLIHRGHVALEIHQAGRGALVIETIGPKGTVGWSWLFPPYRWHFDARAIDAVGAIAIDGACLRERAEGDPMLGYQLLGTFASVMLDRLQATRLRLLDLYGDADVG